MNNTNSLSQLLHDAKPADVTFPRPPVDQLFSFATEHTLGVSSAWRLDNSSARALQSEFGFTPDGGWNSLLAILAGTKAIKATHQAFLLPSDAPTDWSAESDSTVKKRLLEAFTVGLAPPALMASLAMCLGLQPLTILRLAAERGTSGINPEELPDCAPQPRIAVSAAIGLMMKTLGSLPPGTSFPIHSYQTVIVDCIRYAVAEATRRTGSKESSRDFSEFSLSNFVNEFLSELLIPAGVARTLDGQRVAFDSQTLASVRVEDITAAECDALFKEQSNDPFAQLALH